MGRDDVEFRRRDGGGFARRVEFRAVHNTRRAASRSRRRDRRSRPRDVDRVAAARGCARASCGDRRRDGFPRRRSRARARRRSDVGAPSVRPTLRRGRPTRGDGGGRVRRRCARRPRAWFGRMARRRTGFPSLASVPSWTRVPTMTRRPPRRTRASAGTRDSARATTPPPPRNTSRRARGCSAPSRPARARSPAGRRIGACPAS